MPIEITIPRLGWSMEEGTFVEWLKRDGDVISPGDALFSLEGEKALQEIEAVDAGILHIGGFGPEPGSVVPVGAIIGYLLTENESPPVRSASPTTSTKPAAISSAATPVPTKVATPVAAAPSVRRLARELGVDLQTFNSKESISAGDVRRAANPTRAKVSPNEIPRRNADPRLPRISPRAARLAREQGLDWTQLRGSGGHGRIRERDLLAAAPQSTAESVPDVPGTLQTVSRLRRTIAQRLLASAAQTVPVTLTTKMNAARLVAWRQQLKSSVAEAAPTYNDLVVHAVARLLKSCPELNACWIRDAIYAYDEVNIAVAVETPAGLLTPVIRRADSLSLPQLAAESRRLSGFARAGQLTQMELTGGTFTVTNLGRFDIDAFTPVINPPQSAILGIGRLVAEPIVVNDAVIAGQTLTLSLTFDHRVLDGAPAARWLQRLGQVLQSASGAA